MLAQRGIRAYGVDSDESQVEVARAAGRDVRLEDAVEHLLGLATGEVDGVFSSQVAEHLTTNELISSIDLVHRKLAPGGVFVMETPNPEALFIFATFFYVDLTHIKPIHPEALRWAFEACGFEDVQIVRSQRVPDTARLEPDRGRAARAARLGRPRPQHRQAERPRVRLPALRRGRPQA